MALQSWRETARQSDWMGFQWTVEHGAKPRVQYFLAEFLER